MLKKFRAALGLIEAHGYYRPDVNVSFHRNLRWMIHRGSGIFALKAMPFIDHFAVHQIDAIVHGLDDLKCQNFTEATDQVACTAHCAVIEQL